MNTKNTEIITISMSKYLSEEVGLKIAKTLWGVNDAAGMRSVLYWLTSETDGFNVIAQSSSGDFVGRVLCIQNAEDPTLWYYGDLFVVEGYRRRHIADKMIGVAFDMLKDKGCKIVHTYVEPDNMPSLALQKNLGFVEKPYQTFNNLIHENDIMLEKKFGEIYDAVQVKSMGDVAIIADFYNKNLTALHGGKITCHEWQAILSNDTDEENFLICRGLMPVAWLKINGLDDTEVGYISMLAVEPKYQRSGAGTFAVRFAEDRLLTKGKKKICVQTTDDNTAAVSLYTKCGFNESGRYKMTADDGSGVIKIKLIKNI